MLVDALHVRKREVTAPDAGLVGDDEQFEPGVREAFQRRRHPGKEGHVLDAVQIIPFLNQHPVAVEKNSRFHFDKLWFDYGKNGIEFFPVLGNLL
jgi:hypothetical protein